MPPPSRKGQTLNGCQHSHSDHSSIPRHDRKRPHHTQDLISSCSGSTEDTVSFLLHHLWTNPVDKVLECDDLITMLSQLYQEDQLLSQQAQMPQVGYKEFGGTARRGFLSIFVTTNSPPPINILGLHRKEVTQKSCR